MATAKFAGKLLTFGRWWLAYLLLWWLLSAGQGWEFGVPSAALAAAVAMHLRLRLWRLRLRQLPGLGWFLMSEMFLGAWDVARRVISPSCKIAPAWSVYTLTAEDARVRYLVSLIIGLLPGTLATRVKAGDLQVHVLDRELPWKDTVRELELRLDRLIDFEGS